MELFKPVSIGFSCRHARRFHKRNNLHARDKAGYAKQSSTCTCRNVAACVEHADEIMTGRQRFIWSNES